jgi:hypothetical protein
MQQRNGAREVGLLVASLATLARFTYDLPLLAATVLIVVVAVSGTAWLRGERSPLEWRLDRLVLPGLAAFASAGVTHLADPVPWLALFFAGSWLVTAWAVAIETVPIEALPDGSHARPVAARLGAFGLAFLGFAAVGGVIPGGLPGGGQPVTVGSFSAAIVLQVMVGGLAGYRIAAVRPHTARQIVAAFYEYAMALVPVAVVIRVLELPRLFGPALLVLTTYLVTSWRESEEPVRFNLRLLEETFALVMAGIVVAAIGLLAK